MEREFLSIVEINLQREEQICALDEGPEATNVRREANRNLVCFLIDKNINLCRSYASYSSP
jgi:hypothetical protein